MKKSQVVTALIILMFIGLFVGINTIEPSRVSEQQKAESLAAQQQIAEAEAAEARARQEAREKLAQESQEPAEPAGDPFQVEFQCSNGTFVIEVYPEWAPIGAARFREIIEAGLYNEARFFRVVPGFVVQWGIPGDPELAKEWSNKTIKSDPVKGDNVAGTITYAMLSGNLDSRTTQVYINLGDNSGNTPGRPNLDSMGFAPFGKVIKGMDVVEKINAEYGEDPDQSMIETRGNAYLKEYFPKLDYIRSAKILGSVAAAPESNGD